MSTITTEQQAAIAAKLDGMNLPSGLGDEHAACSIAAINLALTGHLTDSIPDCMSEVIGRWIIAVQDAMPDEMRNSQRWKSLLPLAAGTGRAHEQARLALVLDWMWGTVLPTLQPLAEKRGFGSAWTRMTTERTVEATRAAEAAAWVAAAWVAEAAAEAAEAAARAAEAAARAARAAARAARAAARAVAWAARAAARAEARAVAWAEAEAAARAAAWAAARAEAWHQFDPCFLLERLIAVEKTK